MVNINTSRIHPLSSNSIESRIKQNNNQTKASCRHHGVRSCCLSAQFCFQQRLQYKLRPRFMSMLRKLLPSCRGNPHGIGNRLLPHRIQMAAKSRKGKSAIYEGQLLGGEGRQHPSCALGFWDQTTQCTDCGDAAFSIPEGFQLHCYRN